jgi:hypothetical protein
MLLERLREESFAERRAASACVDPVRGTNLVAFHTGLGDGVYDVHAGLDATDRVVAIVTDFGVVDLGAASPPRPAPP